MKTRNHQFLLLILASIFVLLSGCDNQQNADSWPLLTSCDLHNQACLHQIGDQSVKLTITPQPLKVAKPLNVQVDLQNIQADKIELDIAGINMYMGYNRVELKAETSSKFSGQTMFAFCTNELMEWQITLILHQGEQQLLVPFYLETKNR